MLLPVGPAVAAEQDREEILALMDAAFEAIGASDADGLRAIQLAEGMTISFRQDPDGAAGELLMRMTTNEELVAATANTGDEYVERWTARPTVLIRGPIAVVWGEYEFWINDDFSHCGVDAVDLAKVDGSWKIANWMWTVETESCPTDPAAGQ
jgi:hypothetical protein